MLHPRLITGSVRLALWLVALVLMGIGLWVVFGGDVEGEHTVTEVWQTYLGEVRGNAGDVLEVATMTNLETVERRDRRSTWWGLYLGENTTRIRVPATFRYHILLSDPWSLDIADGVVHIHAPRLRPSNPPAIQTRGLERYVERGWLRFDLDAQMADLERGLTDRLAERAGDARHIARVRDEARGSVIGFVERWMVSEEMMEGVHTFLVTFAEEEGTVAPSGWIER